MEVNTREEWIDIFDKQLERYKNAVLFTDINQISRELHDNLKSIDRSEDPVVHDLKFRDEIHRKVQSTIREKLSSKNKYYRCFIVDPYNVPANDNFSYSYEDFDYLPDRIIKAIDEISSEHLTTRDIKSAGIFSFYVIDTENGNDIKIHWRDYTFAEEIIYKVKARTLIYYMKKKY